MRLVKQLVVVVIASLVGSAVVAATHGRWWLTLLVGPAAAALSLAAYVWVVRRTEQREVTEVARRGAVRALTRGLVAGSLLFAGVIGVIALGGGYRVAGTGSLTAAAGLLGLLTAAAVAEEVIFRGVLLRVLESRLGTLGALGLTSTVFGALHLVNPGATLWGAVAVAAEGGLMLGAAYAATRTLWLPIGLHVGWNVTAAGVFGAEVSGSGVAQGLLHGVTSGPALLTGGAFGPEGSVVAVAAGLALTVVLLRLAHVRGRLVPRRRTVTAVPAAATV